MNEIKILELFGGIGAARCGLRNIGIDVKSIDYVEIDEKAVRSYNAMFANELKNKPQNIVGWNLKPDVLIHGSTCQDFSIAGKQKGADYGSETRSSLMWETIKLIDDFGKLKPKIVIWENVKNVRSKHMITNYNRYLSEMEKLGYTNSFETLNAVEFGLPQERERVITISSLDKDPFDFSNLIRSKERNISEFLESNVDDKYTVRQPSMLKKIGSTNSNFKLSIIKDRCKTITCKQMRCPNSGIVDLHNGKYRYLTERECWRLMGYTDEDFNNASSVQKSCSGKLNGALYKQAGNSIPVVWFESIFRKIFLNQTQNNEQQLKLF